MGRFSSIFGLLLGAGLISLAVLSLSLTNIMQPYEVWFALFTGLFITISCSICLIKEP